jgi:hypothetical protein
MVSFEGAPSGTAPVIRAQIDDSWAFGLQSKVQSEVMKQVREEFDVHNSIDVSIQSTCGDMRSLHLLRRKALVVVQSRRMSVDIGFFVVANWTLLLAFDEFAPSATLLSGNLGLFELGRVAFGTLRAGCGTS